MNHPLTDKIIEEELITEDQCDYRFDFGVGVTYYEEDFRAGADWQLEQAKIEGNKLLEDLRRYPGWQDDADKFEFYFNKLLNNLRPQEDSQ